MTPDPILSLSDSTLPRHADQVSVPCYDRSALVPAVVHIGVGGFHRAHQALYFDDLAALGETAWGVVGVGLRRPEMGMVLNDQDGLFTVVERCADGDTARVVGSVIDYHFAPDDPEAVLQTLSDPQTRLVTLTVTGDGYLVDEQGCFDVSHGDARHDAQHPQEPRTAAGYLVEALRRRRENGSGPFTVLSCDNLADSGNAARQAVISLAELRDPELAAWINEHVTFPSSMVDRITPETSPATRDEIEQRFGVPDRWPVVTEPFRQWVVEDAFCAGRPPLDRVGVQFVADVAPYKLVKSRLLNGGHSALGYLGSLLGYHQSDEAMGDPLVREILARMLSEEVLPLLPSLPDLDLTAYVSTTLERFANPAIGDGLDRLCRRGTTKMPSYVLPSLREARAAGKPCGLLVLVVAAWFRYLRGTDLAGAPIEVQDARAESLLALARRGGDDPRPLLGMRSVFGNLADDRDLVAQLATSLTVLSREGLAAALQDTLPVQQDDAA